LGTRKYPPSFIVYVHGTQLFSARGSMLLIIELAPSTEDEDVMLSSYFRGW